MELQEMVDILETIARDPGQYPSARVTAVRTLREIWAEQRDEAGPREPAEWARLYEVKGNGGE